MYFYDMYTPCHPGEGIGCLTGTLCVPAKPWQTAARNLYKQAWLPWQGDTGKGEYRNHGGTIR